MIKSVFLKLFAAAGLALAAPAFAQGQPANPNDTGEYEPAASVAADQQTAVDQEYTPVDPGPQNPTERYYVPKEEAPAPVQPVVTPAAPAATATATATGTASDRASASMRVGREDVFAAAEGVFGKGAEGLADLIEDILKDQGQPSAYITGKEAGGAFVVGARYGSGTLHHGVEGDRPIFWTGPSLGFDFGADASKVFVLVYNLNDSQAIFTRFPAGEGKAYVVGGLTAGYLRRGNTVLIPVRMGAGLRLGVNAGYMRFSEKNRWLPF